MSFFEELKRRNVFRVGVAYSIVAWAIIQVVDLVAPRMALPEWVPGFVILMLGVGLPIALIFAWAYEITPDGLKRTAEVDVAQSVTPQTARKIDRTIIMALTFAVMILLVDRFTGTQGGAAPSAAEDFSALTSIAVLPFANLSSDPEQEFFSDGISEDLLNLLAQTPGLRVAARTSSFQFKGEADDVVEIGRQLRVQHVLDGSVRQSGGQVRISAQLVNAEDGFQLWSETYTRELEDIFALQDEISASIVAALQRELGLELATGADRDVSTSSEVAYQAVLRGRHLVVRRTRGDIEAAIREFEEAIRLDPDYALAHAELALATSMLERNQYGAFTATEVVERMTPHVRRALELDRSLAEAHAAAGQLSMTEGDFEAARASFAEATRINPNYSSARVWLGNALIDGLGRYAEGVEQYALALEIDPLSVPGQANTLRALYRAGRMEEAEAVYRSLSSLSPFLAAFLAAEVPEREGRLVEAARLYRDAIRFEPGSPRGRSGLARVLLYLGLDDEARAIYPDGGGWTGYFSGSARTWLEVQTREAAREPDDASMQAGLGAAFAAAGRVDEASTLLEEAWDAADGRVVGVGLVNPGVAASLLWVREQRGEDSREIRDALVDDWARLADAGYPPETHSPDVLGARYLAGFEDEVIRILGRIRMGGAGLLDTDFAFWAPLRNDPRLRDVAARLERQTTEMRRELLREACAGGEWVGVWEPSAERCTGVGG